MAVKLHRCSLMWLKAGFHPCWRVQSALDEAGVDYEVVKGPMLPRGKREDLIRLTGQNMFPAIEFEDGSTYKEESEDMAETIRAGKLAEKGPAGGGAAAAGAESSA